MIKKEYIKIDNNDFVKITSDLSDYINQQGDESKFNYEEAIFPKEFENERIFVETDQKIPVIEEETNDNQFIKEI